MSTAAGDAKHLEFLKPKDDVSTSISGKSAVLISYLPSLIFLAFYLIPYLNAYTAGNLTGSLLKMGSKGTGSLVKSGRECLLAVMLFGHFVRKFLVGSFCMDTSSDYLDSGKRVVEGLGSVLACLVVTTFSVKRFPNMLIHRVL